MTLAVVVATEATTSVPTAELVIGPDGMTVLERLLGQLDATDSQYVITRPELAPVIRKHGWEVIESDGLADDLREIARLTRTTRDSVLITHGDLVAHDEVLARMLLEPTAPATAAAAPSSARATAAPPIRVTKPRIVSAGSPYHRVAEPNAVFRGMLHVAAEHTGALTEIAERLAALLQTPGGLHLDPARPGDAPAIDDAPALLLVGLVRSGVRTAHRFMPPLVCQRVLDADQAAAARGALDEVDEDRVRLGAAVKDNDSPFAIYAVSSYSRYIARWAARKGLTPNAVTAISMGVSVLAAVWFAAGSRAGMALGAVLLYAAFVFDCVDGQLARYTRSFSPLGAWLDAMFDRAKEYVVYAGLAAGATVAAPGSSVHAGDVWALALAAMVLQSVRHYIDFAFGAASQRTAPAPLPVLPLGDPADDVMRPAGRDAGADRDWKWWAKKVMLLPIAERFALISITAAFFNAAVTFIALLAWGGLAMLYTLAGRVARSMETAPGGGAGADATWQSARLLAYRDDGPILKNLSRLRDRTWPQHRARQGRRMDWLVPPFVRVVEYGFLAALGFATGVPKPLVYTLIGVLAYHHYDTAYRTRQGLLPAPWVFRAGLGWEGRMLLAGAGALLGIPTLVYALLTISAAALYGGESVRTWAGTARSSGVMVDLEAEGEARS